MQTTELKNKSAPVKWWAAHDAQLRNSINSHNFSEYMRTRAEAMKMVLELVYHAKGFYISYGKQGISIKVDHPIVFDRKELRKLEAGWAEEGVTKKHTEQGIIYRIKA